MEESSGPLVHLPNRAPLAGAHLLSHTQKGPSGPLLVFYFLRPRYRAAINEIRQHLFASRPKKRKDGGGEGRQEIPEARTLRPVGCNLAVQSRPQTFSSFALLARREYQGCAARCSQGWVERNSWRRTFVIVARNLVLNPIDGIDRVFRARAGR